MPLASVVGGQAPLIVDTTSQLLIMMVLVLIVALQCAILLAGAKFRSRQVRPGAPLSSGVNSD